MNATLLLRVASVAAALAASGTVLAHGFAGKRFFPATLATEDPFVADELAFPTISTQKTGEGRETSFAVDFSKRITENFGIGVALWDRRFGTSGPVHWKPDPTRHRRQLRRALG